MDIVKNMRRYVASFSLAALIASFLAIGVAQAGTFNDVQDVDWFFTYVEDLVAQGVISVNENYYPARNANRAEMAKLITEAFGLTLVDNGGVESFNDVPADAWYYEYVETVYANGVVSGYKDENGDLTGYYGPGNDVTRAEAGKMLVLGAPLTINTNCGPSFPDVSVTDWFYDYVETSYVNSVIDGYPDGSFGPGNLINRAEIAKMVSNSMNPVLRSCGGFNVSDATALSDTSVEVCYNAEYDATSGLMSENYAVENLDAVALDVTAVEASSDTMCVVLTTDAQESGKTYDLVVTDVTSADGADLSIYSSSFTGYTAGALGTGDLNVELSSSTPTGVTLPSGATSVPMATWNFGAGSEDAVLKSLVVHRFGVSALPGSHQVYLYEGSDRLTSGKSVNSTTNNATFNNINLAIDAGETRTITLRMDTGDNSAGSSGEVGFEIVDADQVSADAGTVFGSFPLQGDLFGLSTTSAGTITVEKNGTITNPKVGEDDVTIAKFKMTTATESASLEQLGIYLTGTVSTDAVENFELYVSGEDDPIATVASLNSKDLAVFVLSPPYEIAKGDTKSMWIKADFNTGRSGDTVDLYIDETTDVLAIGDTYGFGMTVDLDNTNGYDGTACTAAGSYADCSHSVLEGGDITISSSGPTAADVAIAGDDVELLNFSIVSVSNVTFKNFPISLTASEVAATQGLLDSTTANITDIKIVNVDTNETLWGPVDADVFKTTPTGTIAITEAAGDNLQAYYLFTDEIDMLAGDELNLSLRADIRNLAALDGMTIDSTIELGSTYPQIRDINNKTIANSSSLVPASAISGKTMTVSSPSLALALASVPVAGATEYVKGQDGVRFVGISAACGSASKCKVTDVAITGYIDGEGDNNDYEEGEDTAGSTVVLNSIVGSVWLEDADGNTVAAAKSVQTSGAVTFDGMSWTIPAGSTPTFYIVGDISSDAYKGSPADGEDVSFAIAAGGITYEDDDTNSRTSVGAVNGTTSPTTYARVTDGGSLTIAVDASTAKETIIVAGTADQAISKFKFTTTDEAFTVKKLGINARQSLDGTNITPSAFCAYDNNVSFVIIEYTNSEGVTVTDRTGLSNCIANFSSLDFLIDKDDDAVMSVYVDLNTISAGATAGEFVDLNIAFNQFEAIAEGSGETYKVDKLDTSVSATSDLDFGTITWTDSAYLLNGALTVTSPGTAVTATVDTGTGTLPVGTLILADLSADGTWTDAADSVFVLTANNTTTSMALSVIDDDDATVVDNTALYYALPGTGYLTNSRHMHVYETVPTLTLNENNPSGTAAQDTNDVIYKFDVSANSQERVVIRSAVNYNGESDLDLEVTGADAEAVVSSTQAVSASNSIRINLNGIADDDCWYKEMGTDLSVYSRVSGWYYVTDAVGINDTFTAIRSTIAVDTTVPAGAADVEVALASSGNLTEGAWVYFDNALAGVTTGGTITSLGFCFAGVAEGTDAGDYLYLDEVNLYNEKVTINLASDASMAAGGHTLAAYLKGGTTDVTAYVNESSTSAATINFFPTVDLETSKGGITNYYVEIDTTTLITDQGGTTKDLLTPKITYGSATDGTVTNATNGDFWWYDDNVTVKWLGYQSSTSLSDKPLEY